MEISKKVAALKPYPFARQTETIAKLKAAGVDVIRLDIGSPDMPPAPHILEALHQASQKGNMHGYPPGNGTSSFLEATAEYYRRRFGVELDPQKEVTALIGSKEGIFHLSQAVLDPGSVALVPDPGYPVYRVSAEWAGAEVYALPLRPEHNFLPDLSAIPSDILKRARLLWLNYPNNPTGAIAGQEFLETATRFAREHSLLLCHDAAYCDVAFDGYRPSSILQCKDAKEVAVEFISLSKTYNMAGWRIGMLAGNASAIAALRTVKSNIDSGVFLPMLMAGEAAMQGDQEWIRGRNATYAKRRDMLLPAIRSAGLRAEIPSASLYLWAAIPKGMKSVAYASSLLEATGVCVAPGTFFGAEGEGFLRIALSTSTEQIEEATRRWQEWAGNQPIP
jgi:LL-diaminopimelate aminotransferase